MSAPSKPAAKPSQSPTPQLTAALYYYRARVVAVHDGVTCTVDIDLGLMMWKHGETIRLARINAPELTGISAKKGAKSRDHLKALIEGKEIVLATIRDKREKYGRYLGEIWLISDGVYTNINDTLVTAGHAEYKSY
jgi:micrococcal nuclease